MNPLRLAEEDPPEPRGRQPDPLNGIDLAVAKEVAGLEVAVLVKETEKGSSVLRRQLSTLSSKGQEDRQSGVNDAGVGFISIYDQD